MTPAWGSDPIPVTRPLRDHRGMPTLLIRCSLHAGLPEDEFRDWVHGRRRELLLEPTIEDVKLASLDCAIWVLGLEMTATDGVETADAVAGLIGDLRLLGLEPVVLRPDGAAALARDHA